MSWGIAASVFGSALQAGASIYGAGEQADAVSAANAANRANLRTQQGLFDQNVELNRPLIETRDNALNALSSIFGLPSIQPTLTRSQQEGTALIPIPSVTFKDRASGAPDNRTDVYFDPVNRAFTDVSGAFLADYTGDGALPFTQDKNNRVEVRNGRVIGVGNSGENDVFGIPDELPVQAQPVGDVEFIGGSETNPSNFNFADLVNTPQLAFEQAETERILARAANARGLRGSGRELIELGDRTAGNIGRRVDSVVNNLFRMAGFGTTGTALQQGANTNFGNAVAGANATTGNLALQNGQIRASTVADLGTIAGNSIADLVRINSNRTGTGGPSVDAWTEQWLAAGGVG